METGLKRYEPLYLKHRPQALDMLVGQQAVTRTLTNGIEHGKLSHAYLFTGPRGTGKTSTARILAKSLNCESGPTPSPCQKCASCLEIKEGISPAVFEIDAASNNSVDDARALIERAPLVAVGGRFKLYIIDECHMLTKEAFNALLKTIEEPPPQVVFVLATTEEHKVPPTIVSRCQRLMFRLVTQQDLEPYLRKIAEHEEIEIEDEALRIIARRSGGGLRDALGLLDQASLLSAPGKPVKVADLLSLMGALHEDVLIELSKYVLQHDGHEVLSLLNRLLSEGREPAVIAQEIARHFLNLIKASYLAAEGSAEQSGIEEMIAGSPEYIEKLRAQAPLFDRAELSIMIEQLDRLENTCRRSTQPAMHIEMGLLALCHRQDIHLLRDLAQRIAKLEGGSVGAPVPRTMATDKPVGAPLAAPAARPQHAPASAPASAEQKRQEAQFAHAEPVGIKQKASESGTPARQPAYAAAAAPAAEMHEPPKAAPSAALLDPSMAAPVGATEDPTIAAPAAAMQDPSIAAPAAAMQDPSIAAPAAAVQDPSIAAPAARTQDSSPSGVEEEIDRTVTAPPEPSAKQPKENVDEVWERLMEELERVSLPAYSLVSTYGFPLSIEQDDLTVGVMKDQFQKMVENKSDKIKKAAEIATGRSLHIRVKVVAQPPARQAQSRTGVPETQESTDEPEPAISRASTFAKSDGPSQRSDVSAKSAVTEASAPPSRQAAAQDSEPGAVKDAYKIFEGPGSRQIG